ncbi:M1 family aminopeptidase [Pontimicrobium sp. SW4]|uniref:M1 family aminopeptidase n=1 Tax=Pontimicrobium sp. SW4 TaxID=3153519 RepID=A0AAU7BTG7_9FLAO
MKIPKLLFLAVAFFIFGCKKELNNKIDYNISPISIEGKPMLKVNVTSNAELDGETTFLFFNDSWGEENLHNTIQSIKPLNIDSEVIVVKDSGWITIKHPKNIKTVNFEYIIKQDTEGDLTTNMIYRPVIQPAYFHVFAHSLFMIPLEYSNNKETTFDATLNWEKFPENYKLQNSFGTNERIQNLKNITESEFINSVFIGGDYRTYQLNINNNTVAFSTRGSWKVFKDSTMLQMLKKTITAQRDFWNDHSQQYFSVNLTPTIQEQGSSFQGSGLTNSFDCSASNNEHLQVEGLVYLFNHELLHNWLGHLIKNDNEEEQYWFSEGFTDYYTSKNISKFKIYDLDKSYYINKINEIIRLLYTSPVKESPNSDINYDNFWQSRDYEKLPYRRGALFAFYLDHKIKKDSQGKQSLDNLMLAIKEDAMYSNQKITHNYFVNKANGFLNDNIKPFFNKHIEEGKLFDLKTIFTDFKFEYDPSCSVFDLGFEFSEDKKSIKSVSIASKAYKAGLRQGDMVRSRSIYFGSTEHEAKFTIVRNGKEIDVKYYPVREANIPQLKNTKHNIELLTF